ncbi:Retrovirus-related Pol polyprotein from transposon RE1 [Vitis vinifera]|uniref:Retrovirus-related Pol polyprotein from transposon RE1 n=1 Tax=Vitis vinifera TaxID=29760 RepID=A0A438KLB9_VITVI|nr:Retrovirus-related Pol polyprotein from transposon RE1 [Vitis vinifera]
MVSEHESSSMEVNISPAIANPNPLSSTRFVPINFNHSLSMKLDNKNFLIWKQQIVSAIRGYGLQVLSDDEVLVQFLTREDARSGKATKEFLEWEQQDQLLLSWLLSSVSESILPRLVGCDTSFLLWGRLEQYFASQTRAKAKQFKTQLQHTKKGGSTIDGEDQVTLRNDDFSVEEIEALLMAHASRVEKNNSSLDSSPSAHVASSNSVEKGNRFKQDYYAANSQGSHSGYNGGFGRSGDFGRRGGFNGSCGFNWNDNGRSNRGGFRGRGNKGSFQARPPWNSDNQNEKLVTQAVLMVGKVRNGLYAFDSSHLAFRPTQSLSKSPSVVASSFSSKVCTTSLSSTFDLWHRRNEFEAIKTFVNFKTQVELQFDSKIKSLQIDRGASPPILSPTMLPAPTSPISSARPISEMDNIVSTYPHAPNSANTTPAPAQVPSFVVSPQQVVSNPVAIPVQHVVFSVADASVTRTIAKDADNTHPMITRAKNEWKKAMVAEYDALQRNNTWSLVPLPAGRQAIGCKWVYKTKENSNGTVQKYKARLVAKGFHQQAGFDFTETFSPVVKPSTIRVVFTIALSRNWAIKQLDVNNAFLNGDLQEEVFMQQPQGFIDEQNPNLVCRLHKALYGLKQAPRTWFEKLHRALLSFGFVSAKSDQSLFLRTPLPTGLKLRAGDGDPLEDLHGYRSTVGALQYVTIMRSELFFSVNKVCQFMQNPTEEHWKAVKQILRYLQGTLQHGLVVEITWLRSLLSELQLLLAKPPLVWCDNLSTVLLSANPVLHARTKHIELDLYFVRENVIRKEVEVRHVPSADQLADVFTI